VWGQKVKGQVWGCGAGDSPTGYGVERIDGSEDMVFSAAIMAGFLGRCISSLSLLSLSLSLSLPLSLSLSIEVCVRVREASLSVQIRDKSGIQVCVSYLTNGYTFPL